MKITSEQMKSFNPCADGLAWFESVKVKTPECLLKAAGKDEKKLQWCNWGIARLLSRENAVRYAIYAARKVLHIYEEKYPNDDRPRRAIEAAEKYLNEPTEENRRAAYRAADSAYSAADSAADSADSAYRAADSAYRAYRAADSAYSAYRAADSAYSAYRAYRAASAADMKINIISYGIKLLEKQNEKL